MDDQQQRPLPGDNDPFSERTDSPLRPEIVGDTHSHQTAHGQTPYGQSMKMMSIESSALTAFGLAVASWFLIPIVGAIAALIVASGAKRRIRDAEEGTVAGRSLATAAQVIAWANILLFVLAAWLVITLLRWIF